jgi:hypothetical protein
MLDPGPHAPRRMRAPGVPGVRERGATMGEDFVAGRVGMGLRVLYNACFTCFRIF